MSAKRVASTALDWGSLATRIPASNKAGFGGLKLKVDKYLKLVTALPESAPAIDFAAYRSKITVPGMVDNFEASYGALSIPYPGDQGKLAEIQAQSDKQKQAYTEFVSASNSRIAGYQAELAKWEAMMPVEEMNLEEALDAGLTDYVIDPTVPSLFPHDVTWEEYVKKLETADPHDFH